MAEKKPFFMVQGTGPKSRVARVRHDSFEKAKAEADRMAALNPGRPYFIMKSVGTSKVATPTGMVIHADGAAIDKIDEALGTIAER